MKDKTERQVCGPSCSVVYGTQVHKTGLWQIHLCEYRNSQRMLVELQQSRWNMSMYRTVTSSDIASWMIFGSTPSWQSERVKNTSLSETTSRSQSVQLPKLGAFKDQILMTYSYTCKRGFAGQTTGEQIHTNTSLMIEKSYLSYLDEEDTGLANQRMTCLRNHVFYETDRPSQSFLSWLIEFLYDFWKKKYRPCCIASVCRREPLPHSYQSKNK